MTENPYPKHIVNRLRYDAWNEGYTAGKVEGWNEAKEKDARYCESYHFDDIAELIRAEKKVSE